MDHGQHAALDLPTTRPPPGNSMRRRVARGACACGAWPRPGTGCENACSRRPAAAARDAQRSDPGERSGSNGGSGSATCKKHGGGSRDQQERAPRGMRGPGERRKRGGGWTGGASAARRKRGEGTGGACRQGAKPGVRPQMIGRPPRFDDRTRANDSARRRASLAPPPPFVKSVGTTPRLPSLPTAISHLHHQESSASPPKEDPPQPSRPKERAAP